MAKIQFGNTWWGKAWVDAMEKIDYNENRLPRGKTYARGGKVKEITIKDTSIYARVQGSRPSPYKVEIDLILFDQYDKDAIKRIISSNISIAAELNIGKLPENILEIMNSEEMDLFPKSWKEVKSHCSCPDYANPCKHLASVYYIVANEIDKNPFLLFNLKGITTEELMEYAGLQTQAEVYKNNYDELFISANEIELKDIKYNSQLPDICFDKTDINAILSFLDANPLFYNEGDLRGELKKIYDLSTEGINLIDINEEPLNLTESDFYIEFRDNELPAVFINKIDKINILADITTIALPNINKNKITFKKTNSYKAHIFDLFDLFITLPLNTNKDEYSPSAIFLSYLTSLSLSFITSYNFVPEVRVINDKEFQIIYSPIVFDEKTNNAVNYLKQIMPDEMIFRNKKILNSEFIIEILSLNITYIIKKIVSKNYTIPLKSNNSKKDINKLLYSFVSYCNFKVEKFEESNISKSLNDWLLKLQIRKNDITPLIKIKSANEHNYSIEIEVLNKKDSLSPIIPLSEIFKKDIIFSKPQAVIKNIITKQLMIAGEYFPSLKKVLDKKGKEKEIISSQDMLLILTNTKDLLNILGIEILLPKELKKAVKPRLSLNAKYSGSEQTVSYLSLEKLLTFSYGITIGQENISVEEFLKLVKKSKGLIKYKDEYLILKPDEVENIINKLNTPIKGLNNFEILQALLTNEINDSLFMPDDKLKDLFENLITPKDTPVPTELNAKLRDYQVRGFKWLYSNIINGFGVCLADDMGLGKTIQAITLIISLKKIKKFNGATLVVCPMSLIGNWEKELTKFAPSLNVKMYHGSERTLDIQNCDVLITSYGTIRRDINAFKEINWSLLIIDEAQNIKNHNTAQAKAIREIKSNGYIAMTGTPVENRLTELWSIFNVINKGYLNSIDYFKKNYALPIEKYRNNESIDKLKKITSPFIIRRLKSDKSIINDLPDKFVMDEYCILTKEQAALYQQVVNSTIKKIEKLEGIERKGLIFKLITSLKQICNHPYHFSKSGAITKENSGKMELLIELLNKIIENNEKTLIFTQYKEMGNILETIIKEETNENVLFFHGSLTQQKREKMINDFQNNDKNKILIISLKAGGTGLNLTNANNVIHYDLWWNPAVEDQATDRTYRIGQVKNVFVYRFITKSTFEEKIDEMIKAKKEIADLVVSKGENFITEMSNNDLKELFILRD